VSNTKPRHGPDSTLSYRILFGPSSSSLTCNWSKTEISPFGWIRPFSQVRQITGQLKTLQVRDLLADVNECLLRNGHGPCQDSCRNLPGSYECSCEGIPGTRLAADNHTCEDMDECARDNGGCSHSCLNTLSSFFCLCPPGLMLGDDYRTCEGNTVAAGRNDT
jgi:hypothetical protein